MNTRRFWLIISCLLAVITYSCKHEPLTVGDPPGPGSPGDTTTTGTPCSPDVVYFERDVLPILRSNCARSGCHDEATAEDGVVLTSYARVMATADVRPFNLNGSDLYEVLVEDDREDQMPPPPNALLLPEQISLIGDWIQQGAKNESCDEAGECNTMNVSFADDIQPIIRQNCLGCHSGGSPVGGYTLTTYDEVAAVVAAGRLYGAVAWLQGFVPMPFNAQEPLPQCDIDQIKAWIDDGAPDN